LIEIAKLHEHLGAISSVFVLLTPVDVDGKKMIELLPDPNDYEQALKMFMEDSIWSTHSQKENYLNSIQYAKNATENNCWAVSADNYVIDVFGHIYTCTHLIGLDGHNAGEINKLNGIKREASANLLKRDNDPICNHCEYRFVCFACPITRALYHEDDETLVNKTRALHCVETKTIINHLLTCMAKELITNDIPLNQKYDTAYSRLPIEWRAWVTQSIKDGCSTDSIIKAIVDSEYSEGYDIVLAQRIVHEARRELQKTS
jgi:radical SAM protein with 4Fe4S-binding SPASM domain